MLLIPCPWLEQEITGDVLLELDANLLKSEIGIMAFGKRVRIANAIVELRGLLGSGSPSFHAQHGLPPGQLFQTSPDASHQSFPGSVSYHSPSTASMPPHMLHGASSNSPLANNFVHGYPQAAGAGGGHGGHERSYSTSQNSQRSIPGSASVSVSGGMPMFYTQSLPGAGVAGGVGMQQSMSMPIPGSMGAYVPGYGWGAPVPVTNGVNGHGTGTGTESATGSLASRDDNERGKVGLGLVMNEEKARRPAHLSLSPSDGALSDSVKVVNGDEGGADEDEDEDRGHMSEVRPRFSFLISCLTRLLQTDATAVKKTRRRLFGRSHDSTFSRNSKEVSNSGASSVQASPVVKDTFVDKDKELKTQVRPKKSMEKTGSERLSIFGATFSGSLGKGRKPPPRYSL